MSATQQLQKDLQNELTLTNQLLKLISLELHQIKEFTNSGGIFENNLLKNTAMLETLASLQQIDLENIPPLNRDTVINHSLNNVHDTFRNSMEQTQ